MKKFVLVLILFVSTFIFAGCQPADINDGISIKVDSHSVEVKKGDLLSISPLVLGCENALYYTSADDAIFTVSNGVIEGISVGTANLTIGVLNTQVYITVIVKVVSDQADDSDDKVDPIVDPGNKVLTIANGDQNLVVGASVNLQLLLGNKHITNMISWMSSNESVASVSSSGVLSAIAAGDTSVVAIYGSRSSTISVQVRAGDIVTVNPTLLTLSGNNFVNVNDTTILTATPDQGVIIGLVWESSNANVATVNNFGIVKGVATGVVTITARLSENNQVSGSYTLLIKEAATSASPITSITIVGAREVLAGNKIKLDITYTPATEVASFTYSSSNTNVATVDSAGWVSGVSGGVVQITATLVGDNSKNATFSVTVMPLPEGLTITGATQVGYNQNIILIAQAYPVGSSSAVSWSSSNTGVASVDTNGRVTGLAVGTATITATSLTSSAIKTTHSVTVVDQMSITLNPATVSLTVGGSATINATVTAASLADKSVVWSSSNTSVATVSSTGVISAKTAGTANIIAKLNQNNSIQAQATVTVTAVSLPTITISDVASSLLVGGTTTLTATVGNTTNTAVTWASNNTAIATVSSTGLVTAKATGTATVTVTAVANTSVKATCTITVKAPPAGSLTVTADPGASIKVGASGYQIYVRDSGGVSVSRTECTFTSSNSSIATVSAYGTISALKVGTAVITAAHPTKGTGTVSLSITTSTVVLPAASGTPSLVFTSPGVNAGTQMNVSWHHTTSGGYLEYTKKTDPTYSQKTQVTPVTAAATFASYSGSSSPTNYSYHRKTVNLSGLTANTEYIYRIVGSSTSGNYSFKTAATGTFSFIYMSDIHAYPSISTRLSTANSLVTKAESRISNLGFVLFAGDLTAHGSDYAQWKHFNTAPFLKKYFTASVPGNHDYYKNTGSAVHTDDRWYNAMFNNPKNGATGVSNSSYFFKYNNVLFVGINTEVVLSSTQINAQKAWISSVIKANPASFVIAFSHREFFSGSTATGGTTVSKSSDCYNYYGSIVESLGVDLVLSGDDHVYVRTKPIKAGAVTTAANGTVYITSNQIGARGRIAKSTGTYGAKVYGGTTADNSISTIQTITVSSTTITGSVFNASGTTIDTYSIPKK